MDKLIDDIVEILKDYREGNHKITSTKVQIWINQFDENDREFILKEMTNIFKKRYFTKIEGENFLKETIEKLTNEFGYTSPIDFLKETEFLSLQEDGKSQKVLLELLNDVLKDTYSYVHCQPKVVKNYLYIDDILCTGNRMYQDIRKWLTNKQNGNTKIQSIKKNEKRIIFSYIFVHLKNYNKKIKEMRKTIDKDIDSVITTLAKLHIDNDSKYEVVKPIEENVSEEIVKYKDEVCELVDKHVDGKYNVKEDFYRKSDTPIQEKFFTSKENRTRLENIFLETGIEILNNTTEINKPHMRALGFSLPSHKDFGFGALCFTWRNVPNNTPLVFWYSGGGFIPLFEKYTTESPIITFLKKNNKD